MRNSEETLAPQDLTLSIHHEDVPLKYLNTGLSFADNNEPDNEIFKNIEMTDVAHYESYCDLLITRMDTTVTACSGENSQRTNLFFTPSSSDDDMAARSSLEDTYGKWKKLILVAKSIHRFRSLRAERIENQSSLINSIASAPHSKTTFPRTNGEMIITLEEIEALSLRDFRDQLDFFKALEVGGENELISIKEMLLHDPKANLYESENPERLANKPDYRGYSPLYVACKNGNLGLLKLLIQFQANPYQVCKIAPKESESIVSVAARWSHVELIRYLMGEGFMWEERELRKIYNESTNTELKELIYARIGPEKRTVWNTLFPCLLAYC